MLDEGQTAPALASGGASHQSTYVPRGVRETREKMAADLAQMNLDYPVLPNAITTDPKWPGVYLPGVNNLLAEVEAKKIQQRSLIQHIAWTDSEYFLLRNGLQLSVSIEDMVEEVT